MRNKLTFSVILLFIGLLALPRLAASQNAQTGVDAVAISSKYYNSIVKVLLYDSVAAKTNPDKAYLGRGSGFFVSKDGYIFTNRHVINMCYNGFCRYTTYNEDTKKFDDGLDVISPSLMIDPSVTKITYVGRPAVIVQVFTNAKGDSSKLYHAQIIAIDSANFDGAILKINSDLDGHPVTDTFHPLPIGNSDSIKQGQDLCLFGFPAQYGGSFSVMLKDLSTLMFGKHSGYDFTYNTVYGFIKTDAAINNGNSGGPVFGPSNTVVGIATAAFEKTGVGLIGGINAMYYVAALIPDLLKEVTANGLTAPPKKPYFITASLYKPIPLPSPKAIKHSNNMAGKKGFAASKPYFAITFEYGIENNCTADITNYTDANYKTNTGINFNIPYNYYGVSFKIVKPTFLKQANNLVGYFFNLEPAFFQANWSSANIINSPGNAIAMSSNADLEVNMNFSFGFSYTYLFNNQIALYVYYGPALNLDPISNNPLNIGQLTSPTYGKNPISYTRQFGSFMQTTGLVFKLKFFLLGLDYHFGNTINTTYMFPLFGSVGNNNGGNNTTDLLGKTFRSSLSATLGFAL
jgi:S1-C subfamily serine protease